MVKNGSSRTGKQKWICRKCHHNTETPREETKPLQAEQQPVIPEEKAVGLNEQQLRSRYDLRYITSCKCKELRPGVYLSMQEFIKVCGIQPGMGYRDVLMHPEYEPYRGRVKGEIYWSHPDSISKMKDEGILN